MAKILVVDDDEIFLNIIEDILINEGHDVVLAENGELGIEAARSQSPDLIFMDISMPVMDGLEAIRQLKSDKKTKATPILAVTSSSTQACYDEIYEAGGDGYLSKPITPEQLQERITRLLKK